MGLSGKSKEISRVELLVHPFYDLYNYDRSARRGSPPLSRREFVRMVSLWKERAQEVARDPEAILVLVRSGYELPSHGRMLSPGRPEKEAHAIQSLEKSLYSSLERLFARGNRDAGKSAPDSRFFPDLEEPRTERAEGRVRAHAWDYYLDKKKFTEAMRAQGRWFGRKPLVLAYGTYANQCVRNQFRFFLGDFQRKWHPGSRILLSHSSLKFGKRWK